MNNTFTNDLQNADGYGYATIVLGVLFVLSEVMPFIKKHKGNGVVDTVICILRGSACVSGKLADALESCEEKDDEQKNNV